jgi:replicative DNA helicase
MNYDELKIPPHSISEEQAVLGGILVAGLRGNGKKAFDVVSESVNESDFYRQDHRLIFREISSLDDAGSPIDLTTVSSSLDAKGELQNAGGFAYLATMMKDCTGDANIKAYAKAVKRLSISRQLISKLSTLTSMAYSASATDDGVEMLLEQAGREVSSLEMLQDGGDKSVTMKQASKEAMALIELYSEKRGGVIGIDTGIDALNDEIGGWHDTDLIVIPARSGMGKTALAMTFAKAAAKSGRKVGVISTEMANKQLALRHISSNSGVSMVDIRRGNLTTDHWAHIANAIKGDVESHVSSRIKLNDSAIDLLSVQRQARAWKRTTQAEFSLWADSPACDFYAATFERLFAVLVHARARVHEVACEACGDAECRFEIRW